jgi:hypothetical protein
MSIMLMFFGNTDACKDCQAFVNSVCTQAGVRRFVRVPLYSGLNRIREIIG